MNKNASLCPNRIHVKQKSERGVPCGASAVRPELLQLAGDYVTHNFRINVYGTSSENKPDFDSLRRILDFLGVLLYIKQVADRRSAKASSEAGRRIASGCVLINSVVAKHIENLILVA